MNALTAFCEDELSTLTLRAVIYDSILRGKTIRRQTLTVAHNRNVFFLLNCRLYDKAFPSVT
jgi:hypothetical protein